MEKNYTHTRENLLYIALWALLFLTPIISITLRMAGDTHLTFDWKEVLFAWRLFLPFLLVFLVHNYVVAPLFVYKQRHMAYWVAVGCILVLFTAYECTSGPKGPRGGHPGPPPFEQHDRPLPDRPFDSHRPDSPPPPVDQKDIVALIVLVLMLGMNLGTKFYFKSLDDAGRMKELEKKNLEQQLEYLKYQINPHFFMNTLNNIHALVDIDPDEAKHSIVELSKMMRYVLHEGSKSQVPLQSELEFLHHYIALMRLRYTDKVKITFTEAPSLPDRPIPPLLLITFVENAFKHGVSYRKDSFIEVSIDASTDHLHFACRNSKVEAEHDTHGGVGLVNTRKRLGLIYGSDYQLDIDDGPDVYSVALTIPFL